MDTLWSVGLVLLAAIVNCEPSRDGPFCTPYTYTCGPIAPSPPNGYMAYIEAVDMLYNTTHYIEEYYHYQQQMVAVRQNSRETYTRAIFMYPINTAIIIRSYLGAEDHGARVECVTTEISKEVPWMAGFTTGMNNSSMLAIAPSQALLFGSDYKYSWVDNATVRELPCNRWDACINIPNNGTLKIEYHWSDPKGIEDMFGYPSERPVMMHLTGEMHLTNGDPWPVPMDMMYNFGLFDDNPYWNDLKWVFEVPSDVYCGGLPDVKPPPVHLAEAFSHRVELAIQTSMSPRHEFVSTAKVWYNYDRKIIREDLIPDPASVEFAKAGLNEIASIKDYSCGVEYIIDKALGNCTTIAIPEGEYDSITTPSGDITIKDPMTLFGLHGITNLTYYGTKYARGLPCDVWVGHLDYLFENESLHDVFMYEVYLLKPGWHEDTGATDPLQQQSPVPVLFKIQEDFTVTSLPNTEIRIDIEENIFRYEEQVPSMSVYDITPCFRGHDHIRRFQVAFPGDFRDDFEKDSVKFTLAVQSSLSREVQVALIRLQHVMLEFNEQDGKLYCEFTLVDQPQVDNVDFPAGVGPPLLQAVANLQNAMKYLVVILYDPSYESPGHTKLMVAYSDSLREMFEDNCSPMKGVSLAGRAMQDTQWRDDQLPQLDPAEENGKKISEEKNGQPSETTIKPKYLAGFFGGEFFIKTVQGIRGLTEQQAVDTASKKMTRSSPMYTPGDMAGMGIGMFILGLVLGIVIMMVGLRKFGMTDGFESIPMGSRRS
ncbi:uncharacterized protein [Panulirus ornatus]|uniref:uncharacterized protein n=1 Tax=Panulirus ornatus TaxID=150431 RepID=UPI003A89E765